ncbi:permease [Opitutaceae bacterium EW11]|nr:permease [Opitutaceae bacterium EW11]
MHDLRFALRSLAKTPAYTCIALLTLALGIGVNTSMVSLVQTLLFRSAPYPGSERLVVLNGITRTGRLFSFSPTEIREVREALPDASSVLTVSKITYPWTEPGRPAEQLEAMLVSRELMEVFRTQPLLGRLPSPEEYDDGRNQVVLLSESFWASRFGSAPDMVGRTLRLQGETVTIIGVMPARFDYPMLWGRTEVLRPINFTPDQQNTRSYRGFLAVKRLRPGESRGSIGAQLAGLAASQEKAFPNQYPGLRYEGITLNEAVMDSVGRAISWTLLGFSVFILLIACANLANLQLARATAALREYAIRSALGASRTRLVRQLLTESIVLSVAGGLFGLLVALWLNDLFEKNVVIGGVPGSFVVPLDGPVLATALGVSIATGLLFGVVPALFASRVDVNLMLKSGARGSTAGRGHHRMRSALIVGEVFLAVVLLGGAAVMNRGFDRLLHRQLGWDPSHVAVSSLPIPEKQYPTMQSRNVFFRKLEDRLVQLPGVERAALTTSLPLFDYSANRPVLTDGASTAGRAENPVASHVMVTRDYFATLGIPLLEGRTFPENVALDGPGLAIVNASLARRFWPGQSAIGKRIASIEENNTLWREVIGVSADVEPSANPGKTSTPLVVYRPLAQEPWGYVNIVMRGAHPETLVEPMRRVIGEIDPELALEQAGTIQQQTDTILRNILIVARTTLGLAALGLVLAAVGVYGVVSNLVAQRVTEFGIRLALGALPKDVFGDVLKRGLSLAAVGLVLGIVGAYGLGRFLSSLMPRLASPDPWGLALVCFVLLLATLLACWFPARRATKVEPMSALRSE